LDNGITKEELMAVIGENLRAFRKRDRLTQAELAEKVGISSAHYAALENGRKSMSLLVLLQLAEALDVSTDSILKKPGTEHDIDSINMMLKGVTSETASTISEMIRVFVKRDKRST